MSGVILTLLYTIRFSFYFTTLNSHTPSDLIYFIVWNKGKYCQYFVLSLSQGICSLLNSKPSFYSLISENHPLFIAFSASRLISFFLYRFSDIVHAQTQSVSSYLADKINVS